MMYQANDSIAPLPPQYVSGESVNGSGTIKIQWRPSSSADVMGYRVFMSDQPNGLFGQITSTWVSDTIYSCIVNTYSLASKKYFKVKAIDFRENSSDFSMLCIVELPDLIPPSKPILFNTEPQQNGILVQFIPSLSSDVVFHNILRRLKGGGEWVAVAHFDSILSEKVSFLDTTIKKNEIYEYTVQVSDESNNKSNSRVFFTRNKNLIEDEPMDIDAHFKKTQNYTEITWKYFNSNEVSGFIIYRGAHPDTISEIASILPTKAMAGGMYNGPSPYIVGQNALPAPQVSSNAPNLQPIGSSNANHVVFYEYRDKEFAKFKTYYYSISVKFKDGSVSRLSDAIPVSAY